MNLIKYFIKVNRRNRPSLAGELYERKHYIINAWYIDEAWVTPQVEVFLSFSQNVVNDHIGMDAGVFNKPQMGIQTTANNSGQI